MGASRRRARTLDAASPRDRYLADHTARSGLVNSPSTAELNETILIVDDHPSFRKAARLALETDGYIVIGAVADGESAITEPLRRQPDIVLLDVGLPDMTGFEAASRLRHVNSSAV